MSNFILVPGAWLGAWAWKDVAVSLEERGHRAIPVSLTGMGGVVKPFEDIGLEDAIGDVLSAIESGGLTDVVLVGHSFACKVAAAAADRVPDRINTVIYLDGMAPAETGEPQGGTESDEFKVEGMKIPFPPEFLDEAAPDVRGSMRDMLVAKAEPCPVRYFREAYTLSVGYDSVREAFIYCLQGDTLPWLLSDRKEGESDDAVLRRKLGGPFRMIDAGHYPMLTMPEALAEALVELKK